VEALLDLLEQNALSGALFRSLDPPPLGPLRQWADCCELQSHGIRGEELDRLKQGLASDETARCVEVWQRKFGSVAEDAQQRNRCAFCCSAVFPACRADGIRREQFDE
jgi:regulatory protein